MVESRRLEASMDPIWRRQFEQRMRMFERDIHPRDGYLPVSIKVRVTSGCYHREHSKQAFQILDTYLQENPDEEVQFRIEEHESGPEILAYLALAAAGVTLTSSIVQLVTAIINARAQGIKKGDTPKAPLELIVRTIERGDEYYEEIVLRIGSGETVEPETVKKTLNESTNKLAKKKTKKHKR